MSADNQLLNVNLPLSDDSSDDSDESDQSLRKPDDSNNEDMNMNQDKEITIDDTNQHQNMNRSDGDESNALLASEKQYPPTLNNSGQSILSHNINDADDINLISRHHPLPEYEMEHREDYNSRMHKSFTVSVTQGELCAICLNSIPLDSEIDSTDTDSEKKAQNAQMTQILQEFGSHKQLQCGHVYHENCINAWFDTIENSNLDRQFLGSVNDPNCNQFHCPLCKQIVDIVDLPLRLQNMKKFPNTKTILFKLFKSHLSYFLVFRILILSFYFISIVFIDMLEKLENKVYEWFAAYLMYFALIVLQFAYMSLYFQQCAVVPMPGQTLRTETVTIRNVICSSISCLYFFALIIWAAIMGANGQADATFEAAFGFALFSISLHFGCSMVSLIDVAQRYPKKQVIREAVNHMLCLNLLTNDIMT